MKSVTPDESWRTVEPGHRLLPVTLRLPPSLAGTLYPQGPQHAVYVIAPTDGQALSTLQVAVDTVDGPEAFERTVEQYGTTLIERAVQPAALDGVAGRALCAILETRQPGAVVAAPGGPAGIPAGKSRDVFRSVYVPRQGGTLRVGYRIPEGESATWQPVMHAVLDTVRWVKP